MSTKIYNGYRFDKDYSLRELDNLLMQLKKEVQNVANKEYSKQILNELLYIYDCKCFFGEEIAKKRMNEYCDKEPSEISWINFLYNIGFYVDEKCKESKISSKRDFKYDFSCEMHIMPTSNKLLFTLYAEKDIFKEIVESKPFISEYMYQNQTDKPDCISDEEWDERKKDWEEAIIEGIPANHGFTVSLVNDFLFPVISSELIREVTPELNSLERRAKSIAYDLEYPCEKMSMSVLCSDEYKEWLEEKTSEILPKLEKMDEEKIINILFHED